MNPRSEYTSFAALLLVFGVWDSRDTQAKLPRLVSSAIRAFNVRELTRSAQYNPATEYVEDGLLPEPKSKAAKDVYSERGFIHVPATATHGGVIARGGTSAAMRRSVWRLSNRFGRGATPNERSACADTFLAFRWSRSRRTGRPTSARAAT